MNKSSILLLTLLVALTLCTTTGAEDKKSVEINSAKGLHEIAIFFSNDVRGETEPCG